MKEECKRPGVKGDVRPPEASVPTTSIPHASCGKMQGIAVWGRGLVDGTNPKVMRPFPSCHIPPTHSPQTGSEDGPSYTLSLEPEMGRHLRHAWTQTEPPHPSCDSETVRRNCHLSPTGYRGDCPLAWGGQTDLGKHRRVKMCYSPQVLGYEGTDSGSFLILLEK